MRLIDWQYCPKWHLSYFKEVNSYNEYSWWEYWITVGPIQTRWGGKPWINHLIRSPQYQEAIRKILLEDLQCQTLKH